MSENCFECKNKIEGHSVDQMKMCLSNMSDSLETVQNVQSRLKEITEKEAIDQFVNTKMGEPSRMGSK
jgi:protoheme ferro-lyase